MARTRSIADPLPTSGLRQLTLGGWVRGFASADPGDAVRHANRLAATVMALMAFGFLLQASHAATTLSPQAFRADLVGEIGVRTVGLGVLLCAWRLGPTRLRPLLAPIVVLSLLLLLLVWVPGVGRSVNGASRWIHVGLSIQPSELARIALVLWIADRCVRAGPRLLEFFRGVLPVLALAVVFFLAVVLQPDLGAALLLLLTALATMWVGGAGLGAAALPLVVGFGAAIFLAVRFLPYVKSRLDMWVGDAHNEQLSDSLGALANSGQYGVGFANGELRNRGFNYMDSDFVFALVGEEFGFAGVVLVVGLLAAFLWNALRLILALPRRFEATVAFGLCLSVALQAHLHILVSTGLAPPKGMTLPFLSAGGTSFVVSSLAIGLALGAARTSSHSPIEPCSRSNATG